jgi:hypothetical protein
MQIPEAVRNAMKAAPSREAQREVGIQVARETLEMVLDNPRISGAYVYPPFGSYRAVLRLLDGLIEPPADADQISPADLPMRKARKVQNAK